jgi:retron-type reverse transcriptase
VFNDGQSTLLVALDLSAAFDCIDHDTLLNRLQLTFGVSGSALDWFKSYLHRRTAFVKFNSFTSSCNDLDAGVPQGSSLGPALFSLYVASLPELIKTLGVLYHQYADDTQLYISISKNNMHADLETFQQCTSGVQ